MGHDQRSLIVAVKRTGLVRKQMKPTDKVALTRGGDGSGLKPTNPEANPYRDCYFTMKAWNAQKGGAAAILVADDKIEPLITMDTPEEENADAEYLQNITIPSALISKSLGDSIKKSLTGGEMVNMNLDWTEALPLPLLLPLFVEAAALAHRRRLQLPVS
ncbi:hypothetical protein LWI29_003587 [Acer saccharum]|uniref:PA domain-containing protein n=1 Tax=Acer saccharum TaxID=4024 RepID=A0AA39W257_ACESA|nr:hypothetical protein LWI29_003587 [Acer saccharum]